MAGYSCRLWSTISSLGLQVSDLLLHTHLKPDVNFPYGLRFTPVPVFESIQVVGGERPGTVDVFYPSTCERSTCPQRFIKDQNASPHIEESISILTGRFASSCFSKERSLSAFLKIKNTQELESWQDVVCTHSTSSATSRNLSPVLQDGLVLQHVLAEVPA
jgi:hypothetical protein